LRDSTEQVVWTTDLLVGDIVLLTQGDEVPADGLWLDGQTMVIDESALTGESDPFKKSAEKPSFFAGSLVTEHKGRMLVTAVGSNTTGGKIMELLNSVAKTATPLQEKLEKMAIDISKVTHRDTREGEVCTGPFLAFDHVRLVLCLSLMAPAFPLFLPPQIAFVIALATWCGLLGWWLADLAHYGWQEDYWVRPTDKELVEGSLAVLVHDFVTVITLIVVAVPDGLPLATTLSLVFSMLNLMQRNNFVRYITTHRKKGRTLLTPHTFHIRKGHTLAYTHKLTLSFISCVCCLGTWLRRRRWAR
jgi:Ca2+-transporting ATPase